MLGLAEQAGHEITTNVEGADVLVVNTCAFIDRAKQESIDTILEMAALKDQVPGRKLVVTGCLAERYREELKAEIPEIDALLGTGEVTGLVAALGGGTQPAGSGVPMAFYKRGVADALPGSEARRDALTPGAPVFGVDLPTYLYDATTPRRRATPGHYAYMKIAEGCDYKCAFCIIPKMRGRYRSRSIDSLVQEARNLAADGRQRAATHLPGHNLLRDRPRRAWCAAPASCRPERRGRHRVDPDALPLPDDHHRRSDRGCRRAGQGL
jgi:ribosomal protein S12 methylthiotransferase